MKVTGTRKQKAAELLRILRNGPSLNIPVAEDEVHEWLDTWVIPKVKELVPELKHLITDKLEDNRKEQS
jgi:hypothetical protein